MDDKHKILTDENFINSPRHDNDLRQFLNSYPNGAPEKTIARCLKMETEEVEKVFQSAILKLKEKMPV